MASLSLFIRAIREIRGSISLSVPLQCYTREFCIFNKILEQEKTETTESRFELPNPPFPLWPPV
jgi:hypothetical protein